MYEFTIVGYFSTRDFQVDYPDNWDQMTVEERSDWQDDTFSQYADGCNW